jgi:hypothetical protein
MADTSIPVLFGLIVSWATTQGAEKIQNLPGVWSGETDAWCVKINGHLTEVEDVPPLGILLVHKVLVGIAIITVKGGEVFGVTEDDLIAHFSAQMPGPRHD